MTPILVIIRNLLSKINLIPLFVVYIYLLEEPIYWIKIIFSLVLVLISSIITIKIIYWFDYLIIDRVRWVIILYDLKNNQIFKKQVFVYKIILWVAHLNQLSNWIYFIRYWSSFANFSFGINLFHFFILILFVFRNIIYFFFIDNCSILLKLI